MLREMLTHHSLFAASALLMSLSTAALVWMYDVINGREVREQTNGDIRKVGSTERRDGIVKG